LKQGKPISEVASTYYDQLQLYLHLHPKQDVGMIIIGNRNMHPGDGLPPIIVVPVERSYEWKKVNYKRLDELNKALDENLPPRREFTLEDRQCKKCFWLNLCWGGSAEKPHSKNRGVS
jgi:radical SAM protein with 4Fe4S-binding SPASM domain